MMVRSILTGVEPRYFPTQWTKKHLRMQDNASNIMSFCLFSSLTDGNCQSSCIIYVFFALCPLHYACTHAYLVSGLVMAMWRLVFSRPCHSTEGLPAALSQHFPVFWAAHGLNVECHSPRLVTSTSYPTRCSLLGVNLAAGSHVDLG